MPTKKIPKPLSTNEQGAEGKHCRQLQKTFEKTKGTSSTFSLALLLLPDGA